MNYKTKKALVIQIMSKYSYETHKSEYGDIHTRDLLVDGSDPKLKDRIYNPIPGDKIYLYPGCNVPRFKMKQFCQNNKVALVKHADKAQATFIGEHMVNDLYREHHLNEVNKLEIISWLEKDSKIEVSGNWWEELKNNIILADGVYITGPMISYMMESRGDEGIESTPETLLEIKDVAKVESMYNTSSLYFQDEILRRINTGVVMDDDMYLRIRDMLKSTDKENIKLAMEAMANCDYEKSCVNILLLIEEFGTILYNSGLKHHVNFKSLMKFFDLSTLLNIDIDVMITSLLHKKLLSKQNLDRLMPMAMLKVEEDGNCRHFSVNNLILSPEILKGLEDNILEEKIPIGLGYVAGIDPYANKRLNVLGEVTVYGEAKVIDMVPLLKSTEEPEIKLKQMYISYSGLNKLLHSPQLFYKHYILRQREEKLDQHLIEGKVIHCLLLDDGSFDSQFMLIPSVLPTGNMRLVLDKTFQVYQREREQTPDVAIVTLETYSKTVIEILKEINLHQSLKTDEQRLEKIITKESISYFDFLKIKGNKDLIDNDTLERCKRAVEILRSNKQVSFLLGLDTFETGNIKVYNERLMQSDSGYSFGLRGILDNIKLNYDTKTLYINDLKTTGKTISEFQDTVEYFKYSLQAAIYKRLAYENLDIDESWKIVFNFIVIDKYDQVYCFEVTPDSMELWQQELSERLGEVEWHLQNNSYSLPYKFATSAVLL